MRKTRDLQELARRSYWHETDARRIVDAWRRSGEPVSRFAAGLGIDPRRVSRWATRLQDGTSDGVRFVPVRVAEARGGGRGAPIQIELAQDRRLHVPPGFAAEDLRCILALLDERLPC